VFIGNVFLTFATELFCAVGNLAVGIVLARALSPADRGILVLVMTLPWVTANFASLGLPQASIYLVGRKRFDASTVLGNSLVLAVVISLLLVILFQATKNLVLATMLRGMPFQHWALVLTLVPASLIQVMVLSVLHARQRFDLYNLWRLAMSSATLVGFASALVLSAGGLSAAIWAYVSVSALLTVLSVVLTAREVPLTLALNLSLAAESVRFGLKSYVENLVAKLNWRIDFYLIAFFLPPEQLAFYGVATSLAEIAWYFPDSVGAVLFPRLSSAPADQVHEITAKVCRNTLVLTGLIVAGLSATSWFLVPLVYGPVYRATVPPLLILFPGVVCLTAFKVLTRNFTSRNRQQSAILTSCIALTLNVGLDWLLIPRWGIAGAAIASTIGYISAGVLLLALFVRDSGLPWQDVLLPRWAELVGHWQWAKEHVQSIIRHRGSLRDMT